MDFIITNGGESEIVTVLANTDRENGNLGISSYDPVLGTEHS